MSELRPVFNEQKGDGIEWAKWSWNPVVGCLHACQYCYARDIANRFYKGTEEDRFKPRFRPEMLSAPVNTRIPERRKNEPGITNVFVCSMADLFGAWVPREWITQILDVCRRTPQWTYIFLTKNPARLLEFDFPLNAWVGATVDRQSKVEATVATVDRLEVTVKFVSCEPLLERVNFPSMPFDWLIIGGQSRSAQMPACQPEWEWVETLLIQARQESVAVYFKPNLTIRPTEYPMGGKVNA